jgi:DNA-binding LacI/PurR family transcriptional regulator
MQNVEWRMMNPRKGGWAPAGFNIRHSAFIIPDGGCTGAGRADNRAGGSAMSPAAPADRSPVTHFVAVLLSEPEKWLNDKSYYGPMLQGLNEALLERGFFMRPIDCLHEYQRSHFLDSRSELYAGAVFLGPTYPFEGFLREVAARVPGPKVLLDHHIEGLEVHSIREDADTGMGLVVRHLVELGHRSLAYLDLDDPGANPWKRRAIDTALHGAGLPELGAGRAAGCRNSFLDVNKALEWLLALQPPPTAVICCDDVRALLLLQAAAERGLRVPHDLSITGFGDAAVRSGRSQILTSVSIDPAAMGRKAAELIAAGVAGTPKTILIAPKLAVRGSTAKPAR